MVNAVGSVLVNTAPTELGQARQTAQQLGRDEFMKLLIANLQNQDPLKPLEGAEFSAQLAQFSALEQLTQINEKLGDGLAQNGSLGSLSAVSLIGKEVAVQSDQVTISNGEASSLTYRLTDPILVTLKVRSGSGSTVADIVLGTQAAGEHELRLDEIEALSNLVDGTYTVELAQTSSDGKSRPLSTRAVARVTGVSLQDPPTLFLASGVTVQLDGLLEVREGQKNL